jgi:hypothetical protein
LAISSGVGNKLAILLGKVFGSVAFVNEAEDLLIFAKF